MGVWANTVYYWHGTLSLHSKLEVVWSATRHFANFRSFSPALYRYAWRSQLPGLLYLQLLDLLVVFGVNDVYDYESDRRNPRKIANSLEGGILDPTHHSDVHNAAYLSTIFIISSAFVNFRRDNILATILLVLLGWQYSSPPLRLKEVPVLDSLSNGGIVFLAWYCGFSFSGLSISNVPSSGIMLSLCTAGIHALGAVVDLESDSAAGQTTIATAFGKRAGAIFAASC